MILTGIAFDGNSDRTTVLDKLEEAIRAREVTADQTQKALLDREAALQKEAAALRCGAARVRRLAGVR
jgi:hypothetical protein